MQDVVHQMMRQEFVASLLDDLAGVPAAVAAAGDAPLRELAARRRGAGGGDGGEQCTLGSFFLFFWPTDSLLLQHLIAETKNTALWQPYALCARVRVHIHMPIKHEHVCADIRSMPFRSHVQHTRTQTGE
jgi:hypothetical protein